MKFLMLLCCAGLLFGQATETKPKVEDYEVHAQTQNLSIGAEFTVHSYSRGEQMFIAKDFLVVEVAIFPPKGETFEVHNADFTLRINGRKPLLDAQAPSAVVAEMDNPQWRQRGGLTAQGEAAAGPGGVIIGAPPVNRNPFPGSQPPGTATYPPVEIPRDNPSGIEKEKVNPDELLLQTALIEGSHHTPTSGFLYFPFRGRMSSVKTVELLYRDVVLKLR